jgi:hypothetical protein
MNTYFVRFIGDPTGYRVELSQDISSLIAAGSPRWLRACVGITDRVVQIDAAKAYLIEEAAA